MESERGGGSMAKRRELRTRDVEEVRRRIEDWRTTRRKRTAMPEELWVEAAALAEEHGVSRVARALKVHYGSLKRRVEQGVGCGEVSEERSGGFIELSMAEVMPRPAAVSTVVKLSRGDGAEATVELGAGEIVDIVGLAEALWSRRP
jgi:hypothetical protein